MSAGEERSWMPLDLVRWTTDYFARHEVPQPRLDAELLLAHVLGVERIELYVRFEQPVAPDKRACFRELVRRRAAERVPVAYLTGTREFWSLPLAVTPAVLIPRPDTETLVRAVLELAPGRVADIGTGSGAIALALATELPEAEVVAVDLDPAALEVARANAHTLGLEERIRFREGDGVSALEGSFDVIASNPPYIPTAELAKLAPEIGHEPRLALDGGPVGLAMIERLIAESPRLLRPGGALALEVGLGQADAVAERVRTSGASRVERRADLGGIERCVIGWWGTDGAAS